MAAKYAVGQGMVELVADPSVLINSMVDKNDDAKLMNYLISSQGTPDEILVDRSHLAKSPLDVAKVVEDNIIRLLANPYLLIILLGAAFGGLTWLFYPGFKGRKI